MLYKRGKTWWYKFKLYGQTVRESSRSHSKTVARQAEMARRRELELAVNRIGKPRERMPLFSVAADEWHKSLATTGDEGLSPRTVSRYLQCLSPLKKAFRDRLVCDIDNEDVRVYQRARLADGLTGRSVNYEVGTLRQILKSYGLWGPIVDRVRALKENQDIGKAVSRDDEEKLIVAAQESRSPALLPLLITSVDTGLRSAELKALRRSDLILKIENESVVSGKLIVPRSKTPAGAGRVVPLSRRVCAVLTLWLARFTNARPDSYVFPFHRIGIGGDKCEPVMWDIDLSKPMAEWKNAWTKACRTAGVKYRWHDLRHTFISRLAENPAVSEQTIRSLAGHVSRRMMDRYSHIRDRARRAAIEVLETQVAETPLFGESGHKSRHSRSGPVESNEAKSTERIGGPSRTRTCDQRIMSPPL